MTSRFRRSAGLMVLWATTAGLLAGCQPTSGDPEASPAALSFPATAVGLTANAQVSITNVHPDQPLTVESMAMAGADAAMFSDDFDDDGAAVLQPGQATTVTVRFSPTAPGTRSATLRVNHSGADELSVPLTGEAVDPAPGKHPLIATPATVGFTATTVGASAVQSVSLRNGSTSKALTVTSTAITGVDAAMFSDDFRDGTSVTLRPGEAMSLRVTFAPSAAGVRHARIQVTHSGTNTSLAVELSGEAVLTTAPAVLHRVNAGGPALVGTPAWGEDSAANPSPHGNTQVAGNSTGSTTATVDLSDPSVPSGTPGQLFQTERTDPAAAPNLAYSFPVPSGTPVEVRLLLAETNVGAHRIGGRIFDVEVEGSVLARDVDVFARVGANRALVLRMPAVSDGSIDLELVAGVGSPAIKGIEVVNASDVTPPRLAAAPSLLDFGQAAVGVRTSRDVVLTNIGTEGTMAVTGTAISGSDARMFADGFDDAGAPVVLAPGQSRAVPVAFLPSATGARSATLSVRSGAETVLTVPLVGAAVAPPPAAAPSFTRSTLTGTTLTAPTSLQFGPDGRLYVAQMDGTIRAFTVARAAPGSYQVTAAETISAIRALPNHDDNGSVNAALTGRLITGLLVTGTAQSPRIYAVSSDPRIGAGTAGTDLPVDTNSGVLSRLTRVNGVWQRSDLVRGLPRSEENHTGNGLALDPTTNTLFLAYGGHTNRGAPSHNFAFLPEFALSAAVLSVDLDAIGDRTYDLPTLDDQDRPGTADANDPFGGNEGRNQAVVVPGGPVQVYAPGFRNPYDLVLTTAGRLFTIDNGANAGWGGISQPDDGAGACTNAVVEAGDTDQDSLVHIPGPGFYGGHPNPTRANRANTFNPGNPQSPVPVANPVECDYRTEAERGALAIFPFSANGLDEYTASSFGGSLRGDLLTAGHDGGIHRIDLGADGLSVNGRSTLFSAAASLPLDVTTLGDTEPFPGTVWVADFVGRAIVVFEPQEITCSGTDDPALDEDADGYRNADEIDNGTSPCSAGDTPPDADGDLTSDLTDTDDDNDGRPDTQDPFAVDPANGRATALPVSLTWDNTDLDGGLLGLGLTGLMTNGTSDYLDLFDPAAMTARGAGGVVTVDSVGDGDALGTTNTQQYGFQLGIDVGTGSPPFVVHTRLPSPFASAPPTGLQSYGIFFGTGTQDDYVRLAVAANGGAGGLSLTTEVAGSATVLAVAGPAWPGPGVVDLYLRVDPAAGTVTASYAVDGAAPVAAGPPQPVPLSWFTGLAGPAAGIISTSAGPAPPFPATWDFLEVLLVTGG